MNDKSHTGRPRVVIVGAGFGGLTVAKALAKAPVEVTVIDQRNYHLFQPLLYQVATAALSPADIASPIRTILRGQRNTSVMLARATGIDMDSGEVVAEDRRIPFDYLVLATGARHAYFGHDDWEAFAKGIKTFDDATNLRRKILLAFEKAEFETDPEERDRLLTFMVVGAARQASRWREPSPNWPARLWRPTSAASTRPMLASSWLKRARVFCRSSRSICRKRRGARWRNSGSRFGFRRP
jgi:NADH dehydrogenase